MKQYRVFNIDPPWKERGGGKIKRGADAHYPLLSAPEILETIAGCPLFWAADNAHMYLWVTDNFLPDGLWVMSNLGFTYKRTFQWIKVKGKPQRLDFETGMAVGPEKHHSLCEYLDNGHTYRSCTCGAQEAFELELRYGIGQYARGAHEMMLFGVRGAGMDESVLTDRRDIPSVLFAPVPRGEDGKRIHSRKPDASYELIEARSKGPYAEIFARRNIPKWTSWGLELPPPG